MSRTQAIRITPARRAMRSAGTMVMTGARWFGIVIGGFGGAMLLWALFVVFLGWRP